MILRRVIGVFGVLVGLQVSNWNEARQDRKDERFYLARLREDLLNAEKSTSRQLQKRIDKRDALTSATLTLRGRSDRDTLSEAECNAVGGSHVYSLELMELSALTELRSAWRLSIAEDEGIPAALIALQSFLTVLAGNARRYDAYVRVHLEPWAAQFKKVCELVDGALGGARDVRAGGRLGQSGGLRFRSASILDAFRPIQRRLRTPCRAASAACRKVTA